jgi:hypothetical protein
MPTMSEHSINIIDGGTTIPLAISGTSAQSAVLFADNQYVDGPQNVVLYSTTDCFIRKGANPTALSNGTDMIVPAQTLLRTQVMPGERIAAITASATGTLYIMPGA